MATTNTTAKNPITKVTLEPGMKIALEQNGVPLTAEQLDGKSLAVTKSGDSLMVTMPDGSQTELVDFFITEDVTLEGDFWEIPADSGLTQTASGVIAQPTTLARAADAGVLGEEAIATDVSATEITEAVSAVVAETAPAVGAGGFGGVLAGLAGLGLAVGGGGTPAPAAADTVLSVGIFAGPLIDTHQLRIAAYDVDGNVLSAEKAVVLVDGRVEVAIRGDYTGAVLLKVIDTGDAVDYVNEVDGQSKDLAIDLRAIVQVDGTGQNMAVNVTPLSELVVRGLPAEGEGATAEQIAAENAKVIKAFDLEGDVDITLRDVVTTVNAAGEAVEGSNLMGQMLAAISGLENSDGLGTDDALTALREAVDADVESDAPSAGTTALLAEGALLVDEAYGGGTTLAQAVDKTQPTVTITDDEAATGNIAGGDITYTLTFSEAVTDFTAEDISVGGGVAGTFTALSDTVYTLVVTPTAGYEGNVTVDVAGAVAVDAVGNSSIEATQSVQPVDMPAPTVLITSNVDALKIGETAVITFTFSEAPTGFDATDVTTTGGTLTDLTVNATDAKIYTATFTPTENSTTAASITVGMDYTDAAGNTGVAGTAPSISVDTLVPTITTTTLSAVENGLAVGTLIGSDTHAGYQRQSHQQAINTVGTQTAVIGRRCSLQSRCAMAIKF